MHAQITELTLINTPIYLHPSRACCYLMLHHLSTAVECKTTATLTLYQRFEILSNTTCPLVSVPIEFLDMTNFTCSRVGGAATYCNSNQSTTTFGFQLIRPAATVLRSVDTPAEEVRGLPVQMPVLPPFPDLLPAELADLTLGPYPSSVPLFSKESGDNILVILMVVMTTLSLEVLFRWIWWLYPLCAQARAAAAENIEL